MDIDTSTLDAASIKHWLAKAETALAAAKEIAEAFPECAPLDDAATMLSDQRDQLAIDLNAARNAEYADEAPIRARRAYLALIAARNEVAS